MSRQLGPSAVLVVVGILLAFATAASAPAADPGPTPTSTLGAVTDGVVAFYFHGNVRCSTCRTIEAYAAEAIQTGFAEELTSGALTWRGINVDPPENQHFVQDFQLTTRSVVLAEYRDGQVVRSKNLDKVWQLVRSKEKFVAYVQDETRAFLGAS